jgi:hypothetical protein
MQHQSDTYAANALVFYRKTVFGAAITPLILPKPVSDAPKVNRLRLGIKLVKEL